ncbi:MAG TPA: flagellar basal body-associated FliL family protein [Kofleriaceae bacterium]|jgi:flagellar FliL protein|nr:flagellar basal body-associated FliL family protein [Kofleriaceae bacterium]
MSDEEAPPIEPVVTPPPKPSKAMLGLLVLNLGATGFVVFKLLTAHPAEAAAATAPAHPAAAPTETMGPIVSLDPFVVNLDEPGTSRYLKCTLRLEVAPKTEEAISNAKEVVRDVILSHLSGLHLKDTLGAEAKDKIRQDLVAKITKLVGPDKVRRLFFADFVVQ